MVMLPIEDKFYSSTLAINMGMKPCLEILGKLGL